VSINVNAIALFCGQLEVDSRDVRWGSTPLRPS